MASFDERGFARPIMEQIHEATGETVFLCVRRGFEAVCIDRSTASGSSRWPSSSAAALPLHAGAASRALLAYEPETVWRALHRRSSRR